MLNTETSFPYLHDEVFMRGKAELNAAVGSEERAIRTAHTRLTRYIEDTVAKVANDPTLAEDKKAEAIGDALKAVRDEVLNLRLIFVEVGDRDADHNLRDAQLARQGPRTGSDLVKAHLLQLLPKKSHLDRPREKWDSIVTSSTPARPSSERPTSCSPSGARATTRSPRRICTGRSEKQIKKPQAERFLNDLVSDAGLWREVNEPEYRHWAIEQVEAEESLRFFRDFNIRQPMPLVLSLIREFEAEQISIKQFKRALRAIEDYPTPLERPREQVLLGRDVVLLRQACARSSRLHGRRRPASTRPR